MLIWAEPGIEAEPLLFKEILEKKAKTLFITNKDSLTLINEAKKLGYDLSNLNLVDLHNFIIKKDFKKIKELIKKEKGLKAINDLSPLIDNFGEKIIPLLKRTISVFVNWPYESSIINLIKETFDLKVYLNSIFINGEIRKYYSFFYNGKWKHIPFLIKKGKGFVELSPRIIIIGPEKSGKTTLLKSLSTKKIIIDKLSENFRVEKGNVNINGLNVELFGANGNNTKVLDLLGNENTKVIITLNNNLDEVRNMIIKALSKGMEVVINSDYVPQELMDLDIKSMKINHQFISNLL